MADLHIIKVPDVGEGIAEVELVAWHVAPGELVAEDQPLADVMTDKANVEVPSPVAGRVLALGGEVGRMLAVGSELIRIDKTGAALPRAEAAGAPPPEPATPPPPAPLQPAPALPATSEASEARDAGDACNARDASPARAAHEGRPIASPAVRRRAWELGLDLSRLVPSGTGGRIVQADLDAALARGEGEALAAPSATKAGPPAMPEATTSSIASTAATAPGARAPDEVDNVPVIGLRRRIALQMQEAKRRIPHFSYVEELDVTEAESLRATLNAEHAARRGHLTLLPLIARAMVLALREHPHLNARFDDEAGVVARHRAVHLGVATQTRHGLLVPVVRHAEALDLWALAAEVARLADVARAGRATRDELSGSTVTLSSLGALGGIVSTPVINRPEVAIVGVNRMVARPVVRDGAVVVRQTMNLSSSFDHRVVDGADAAAFIQEVRRRLEHPALLFV